MKNKTVCFTGHRNIQQRDEISDVLRRTILRLIDVGYCYFGTGGALGFDTLAAETILSLRRTFPHIRLILVLPCWSQAHGWEYGDKIRYEEIKQRADKVVYTSDEYFSGCMHRRNRHLVDHSSVCVCYLTQNSGGTFCTVNYAKEKGLQIINIAETQ